MRKKIQYYLVIFKSIIMLYNNRMDKVLVILPDSNKGKFISKGYSSAFRDLSYFVIEKKIYDLNIQETEKLKPDIIFAFWSDLKQSGELKDFFLQYKNKDTVIIHYAEVLSDIPSEFQNNPEMYCFSIDNKNKQYAVLPAVMPKDYKRVFKGYKYEITFAGNPAFLAREVLLSKLVYNFGIINVFCRSFDFYKSVDDIYRNNLLDSKYIDLYRESYRGYVENQKELSYIYSHSKINIDMLNPNEKPVNYRFMEILSSGGFVLAAYNDVLASNFDDGKEFETYKSESELIDKAAFYLANTNLAHLIAEKGKRNVVSNHSFYDRLKVILKVVYGKNSCN